MLLAKQHYHAEAEPEAVAVTAAAGAERSERRGRLADWCIGEPLLQRGWDLSGLLAVAEREGSGQTGGQRADGASSEEGVSSQDAVAAAEERLSSQEDSLASAGGVILSPENATVSLEDAARNTGA